MKRERRLAERQALEVEARTDSGCSPRDARAAPSTVSAPALLSAALSASACETPPSTTVIARSSENGGETGDEFAGAARAARRPTARPVRHWAWRRRNASARAARRCARPHAASASCLRSCTRAAAAVCKVMARPVSDNGMMRHRAAVGFRARQQSSPVRMRVSQVEAAAQPSSIRSASGPDPPEVATDGFHIGPAAAKISSAASDRRSSVSHHGVRDGVSSFGAISNSSRAGGNSIRRGRGGISRSSHHSTGRLSRPSSTSGCAKPSGNPPIMRRPPLARSRDAATTGALPPSPMRACRASTSSLAGRSVRWMMKLARSRCASSRMAARWAASLSR